MRRLLIFPVLPLLAVTSCGVAGGTAEGRAADDARATAREVARELYDAADRPAQDIGHLADDIEGVEVLRVRPDGRAGAAIVVRVSGTGREGWPNEQQTVTLRRCFELRVTEEAEWDAEPDGVECPARAPLTFAPWPEDPEIPSVEEIGRALPKVPKGGTVREAEVREAVEDLGLDPGIKVQVGSFPTVAGVVGVVLTVKPYFGDALDCTVARVAPGGTNVWIPPRVQRLPGEGGCFLGNAVNPLPPPH
ncbi:translation initiation factor IF-2 [Actinomadura sp. WMMB 499]|uniref:translation initiation factor IF-2 n=1 Tax=Actinomadura sp. WMMB 499 TaxID=1219491 RepID=UPI001244D32A|nr:translation initiation factor IF-2 [Actinomadura sp. WMMB 499]QFG24893.1 translation initiation factor IF-2 [Actinomadura sp. WMMB 499]